MYDPHAKLSDEKEGWLALAINHGMPFSAHAASILLRECKTGYGDGELSWEAAYYMIRSAIAREDADAVRVYVNDWSNKSGKRSAIVSKFIPGDHYYVLNDKFDTLEKAQDYLRSRGYIYGGLVEKYVPRSQE